MVVLQVGQSQDKVKWIVHFKVLQYEGPTVSVEEDHLQSLFPSHLSAMNHVKIKIGLYASCCYDPMIAD